jgi:hypothetical protein
MYLEWRLWIILVLDHFSSYVTLFFVSLFIIFVSVGGKEMCIVWLGAF